MMIMMNDHFYRSSRETVKNSSKVIKAEIVKNKRPAFSDVRMKINVSRVNVFKAV